ncbi:MAG: zinc-ribbon domain-containing protein [Persicimonas sp.]
MIVRCPECSTGFKLPRDQVSDEGVKLRCSKCSHVFRFRIDDDGETEIFYNDSDRERNAQLEKDRLEKDQDQAGKPADDNPDDEEWEESPRTQIGTPGRAVSKEVSEDEEEQAAAMNGNKTAFGMPTAQEKAKKKAKAKAKKKAKKRSKSASSDYNPFPHANLDLSPIKESASSAPSSEDDRDQDADPSQAAGAAGNDLDWDEGEATRIDQSDPFDDEADAFGGAFDDDHEADAFGGAFDDDHEAPQPGTTTAKAPGSGPATTGPATTGPATAGPPASAKPAQAATATKPPQQATKQAPPTDAAAPVAAAEAAAATATAAAEAGEPAQDKPAEGKSSPWQTDNAYRPEDMVDPSFGEDGPSFDPDQGVVTPNKPAANQPAASQPAASQPQNSPAAAARANRRQPASSAAAQPASAKAEAGWDVDPVDDSLGSIEPHTVGGSGLQKTANFVLIALIVVVGFFGLLAALSGGMLDFKRFPHMLEVAFEGAEFEPREEWTGAEAPEVAVAPENPVRINSVFATRVALDDSDEAVFLVRGKAENIAEIDFSDVVVRGILYDKNERVVAQTKAPLGGRLLQSELAAAASADEAATLLPTDAAGLSQGSTQPFSLVFNDVPQKVLDNPDLLYKVEIAESNPPADQPPEAATGD